ncbi:MAG: hypothetical protein WCI23_08075 [Chlorobiaceae bacterium]|jgi:hypothetical protein
MGNCKYCGKPVGFLRSKHPECEQQHLRNGRIKQDGIEKIVNSIESAIQSGGNFDNLEKIVAEIEQSSGISPGERKDYLVKGWEKAVEQFLNDGIIDDSEEKRLINFTDYFSLPKEILDGNGAWTKVVKAAVLRDILNGIVPLRVNIEGSLSINLQKNESIVWAFPRSEYLEDKVRRQFVGGSQGLSFKVAKGVYFRTGAFKGRSVESTERVRADVGMVVVTNKHIYFSGSVKSFRVPYAKIVSFEPFSDGIGIMRDAANAKAQIFVTGDGWFIYNLVTGLSRI